MKPFLLPPLVVAALLSLAGCGGGGGSTGSGTPVTTSHTLTYVNPTNSSGQFALLRDPASTGTNLVLDVVAPSGMPGTGVTFSFDVDTSRAVWATAPALVNGTVFTSADLGTGTQLAQGWVAGARLQGIVSTKGLANQIQDLGAGVIAKITLTPAANATAGAVTLTDSGMGALMQNFGPPAYPMVFAVGTLTCN